MNGLVDRVRAGRTQLLMLLAFLGLAVLLLGSTWGSPTTRTLGGGVGDPGIFTWSLRWTPFAIGRQISPLFSDYLNHPDGINLMWNTWVPLPGLLLSPLTLAFGPVLSFNVLLTLAYGLSAWSAYLAIHRYVPSHGAAAAGGLVYGFSPAMVAHSHHLNLILIFLLPWLLVLVEEIVARQDRSPVWLGVALGVAAAAQVLIGVELFAAAVLLGGLLLVALLAMQAPLPPGRVRFAATGLAVALVVFAALAAWPLKEQVAGPGRVHGDLTEEVRGSSDLLAVVTPSRLSAIAPDAAIRRGDRFAGSRETYLGIPLLLVVAVLLVRHRSLVVGICATMLVVCMVLSLGSRLRVGGHLTPIRLPWTAIESLPLLRNIAPARFALLAALFAGLLLAVRWTACGGTGAGGGGSWPSPPAWWCWPSSRPRRPCSPGRWWPRPSSSPPRRWRRCPGTRSPWWSRFPRRAGPTGRCSGRPRPACGSRCRAATSSAPARTVPPCARRRRAPPRSPSATSSGAGTSRPDPGPAPADGRGLRQVAGPLGGPSPDAAPPGHGRLPHRPARPPP